MLTTTKTKEKKPPLPPRRKSTPKGVSDQKVGKSDKHKPGSYTRAPGKVNSYFESIRDPWNVFGARIPDMVTVPSVPVRWVVRFSLSGLTVTGDFGFVLNLVNCLYNTAGANYSLSWQTLTSATAGAYVWGAPIALPNAQTLANQFQFTRLVSAGLVLRNDSAYTADQGRMAAVYQPSSPLLTIQNGGTYIPPPSSWAAAMANPYAVDVPASTRLVEAKFVPLDVSAMTYGITSSSATSAVESDFGNLVVLGNGLQTSPPTPFDVELVINLEGIPITGSATVASQAGSISGFTGSYTTPSWSDPLALADAANRLAASPEISVEQPLPDIIRGTPFRAVGQQALAPMHPWVERAKLVVNGVGKVAKFALPVLGGLATALAQT
jgi:hypothetical protein